MIIHGVDVLLMGSRGEPNGCQDGVDMFFPEASGFGVTLEGTADGDHGGAIQRLVWEAIVPPFVEGVINAQIGRNSGSGRVSESIDCIPTKDGKVFRSTKCDEQPIYRVFQARGKGVSLSVKGGSGTLGTITTAAGTTFAIDFDTVLPVQSQYLGGGGRASRGTKHAKIIHLVKLCNFILVPEWPGVKLLEAMTGEARESTLGIGDGFGLEGMNSFMGWVGMGRKVSNGWVEQLRDRCLDLGIVEEVFNMVHVVEKFVIGIRVVKEMEAVEGTMSKGARGIARIARAACTCGATYWSRRDGCGRRGRSSSRYGCRRDCGMQDRSGSCGEWDGVIIIRGRIVGDVEVIGGDKRIIAEIGKLAATKCGGCLRFESQGEMKVWAFLGPKSSEDLCGVGERKDGMFIDGHNVSAVVAGGLATERFGTGVLSADDRADVDTPIEVILAKFKTVGDMVIGRGDSDENFLELEEGTQTCQEGDCGVVLIEGGDGVRVGPLQILNIGGQIIAREIIHAFVKAAVIGVFDAVGVGIIPDNVASGATGEMAEVDAGNGISFVFDFALVATGFDPDATTKGAEAREVSLLATALNKGGFVNFAPREGGILDE